MNPLLVMRGVFIWTCRKSAASFHDCSSTRSQSLVLVQRLIAPAVLSITLSASNGGPPGHFLTRRSERFAQISSKVLHHQIVFFVYWRKKVNTQTNREIGCTTLNRFVAKGPLEPILLRRPKQPQCHRFACRPMKNGQFLLETLLSYVIGGRMSLSSRRYRVPLLRQISLVFFCFVAFCFVSAVLFSGGATRASAQDSGRVEITLAPPKDGWIWSGDAILLGISTADAATKVVVQPKDFPLTVETGGYLIEVDGIQLGKMDVSADTVLTLPPLGLPFLASIDDTGQLVRGRSLVLRSPDEMVRLLQGRRPLALGETYGRAYQPIARANNDPELVQTALEEVRSRFSTMSSAYKASWQIEDRSARKGQQRSLELGLELLAVLGAPDDAKLILQHFNEETAGAQLASIALVRLERRLGNLDTGFALKEAERLFDEAPEAVFTAQLIDSLARAGSTRGLELLADLRALGLAPTKSEDVHRRGLSTLSFLPIEQATEIYRDHLVRLSRHVELSLKNGTDLSSSARHRESWVGAGLGLALLSAHGTSDDYAIMDLPVPAKARFQGLISVLKYPTDLIGAYYQTPQSIETKRVYGWHRELGELTCAAIDLRTDEDARAIIDTIRANLPNLVTSALSVDYPALTPADREGMDRQLELIFDMAVSHCDLTSNAYRHRPRETATEEEIRRFGLPAFYPGPSWWLRPAFAENMMTKLSDPNAFDPTGLAPFSNDWLLSLTRPETTADSEEFQILFELHHRLLTDAFQSPGWHYGFNAERRVFRLRNNDGEGNISIAGIVDVLPVQDGDTLQIAIRNDIHIYPNNGSFIPEFTDPLWEAIKENNKLLLFRRVAVERHSKTVDATYVRSLQDGVHIFSLPFDGDYSDAYLRLDLGMDTTLSPYLVEWPLDIALYESQFAFSARIDATNAGGD